MDPDEQRALARERWERAAAGWAAARPALQQAFQPISERMVELAGLQPGQTVLEVGAGVGDTGLLAAGHVGPQGRLISTDGAEAMVEAAKARAAELGVTNAEFRPMELEWLDLPTAAVDVVLARFAYMLALDMEAAVREARRVLRPGGRFVIAVWQDVAENPWNVGSVVAEVAGLPPSPPDAPGPFRLGDRDRLRTLLEDAGFLDVAIEPIEVLQGGPSLDDFWEHEAQLSPSLREVLPKLSPADHTRLRDRVDAQWAPYVREDGSVAVPGRAWIAAADA